MGLARLLTFQRLAECAVERLGRGAGPPPSLCYPSLCPWGHSKPRARSRAAILCFDALCTPPGRLGRTWY